MKRPMQAQTCATLVSLVLLVFSLFGCGGGDDPAGVSGPPPAVSGVAATGAPIVGEITLKDSSSPPIVVTGMTSSDGSFALRTEGLTAPFFLRTTVAGKNLYSIATANIAVANINPLTTMVVSVAADGADLDALFNQNPIRLAAIVAAIPAAETKVQSLLSPLLGLYGVRGNFVDSAFSANHAGADALLDGITVTVSGGANATIAIANKSNGSVILPPTLSSAIAAGTTSSSSIVMANIPPVPTPTAGTDLYTSSCAGCHGDISSSSVSGRSTVDKILSAIATDLGGMGALSSLSTADIRAINAAIPTTPAAPAVGGPALYAANCAGCHRPLATSTKLGITIVRLQNAIASNAGASTGAGMGRLSVLSAADMQAIVMALNQTPATPPPVSTSLDGATIYAENCAGCHGPLASSTKIGLTASRFANAVTTNSATTGMGYLASLSAAQIDALVIVLTPISPVAPTYASTCATCHGALSSSTKAGKSAAAITSAIAGNTGGMGSLSWLTSAEITAIAAELATVAPPPPPVGGADLYTANCSGCHGALASSAKGGKSAAQIQAAITANTGGMGYLGTTLTAQQIADIATALAGVTPPVPTTPAGLYDFYCSGCHGAIAATTKGGATAAKITASISANRGGMGSLSALTTQQIADIASALATVAPPVCGSCHAVTPTTLTTGRHTLHLTSGEVASRFPAPDQRCGTCHGIGYSSSTNVSATHNDGVKNVAVNAEGAVGTTSGKPNSGPINWVAPVYAADGITVVTKGTCTPGCHGKKSW